MAHKAVAVGGKTDVACEAASFGESAKSNPATLARRWLGVVRVACVTRRATLERRRGIADD